MRALITLTLFMGFTAQAEYAKKRFDQLTPKDVVFTTAGEKLFVQPFRRAGRINLLIVKTCATIIAPTQIQKSDCLIPSAITLVQPQDMILIQE